jgi:hypothetical protein
VYDYFGDPVLTGVYDGNPLEIPMTGVANQTPIGAEVTDPIVVGPEFGAFVLLTHVFRADTDMDGDVDSVDLNAIYQNYTGSTGSGKDRSQGDTDYDGDVDTADLSTAYQEYTGARVQQTGQGVDGLGSVIPEPSSWLLCLFGSAGVAVMTVASRRRWASHSCRPHSHTSATAQWGEPLWHSEPASFLRHS